MALAIGDNEETLRLDFGASGNAGACCVSGWSTAEPQERWAVGFSARLRLPRPVRPADYMLLFRLRPFTDPLRLPVQRLDVVVNGEPLASFKIKELTLRAVALPWRLIATAAEVDIVFRTPDATAPHALGVSGDDRVLSLAFASLVLYSQGGSPAEVAADDRYVDHFLISSADRMNHYNLMMQFESLGQNCEFGLVQRRCGAEPLGLLRFSSTPLPQLLAALEAGFVGMGRAETTKVEASANGLEYMIHDTAFGFRYHAWVDVGAKPAEEVLRRELQRLPFLVRKLSEDLQTGEKIFVFRGMGRLPEEEVYPLAVLLRRYGPNTLLFVTLSDDDHAAGTVVRRAAGFLVGYIDRFAPGSDAHDLLLDQWVTLCRETCRVRLALRE